MPLLVVILAFINLSKDWFFTWTMSTVYDAELIYNPQLIWYAWLRENYFTANWPTHMNVILIVNYHLEIIWGHNFLKSEYLLDNASNKASFGALWTSFKCCFGSTTQKKTLCSVFVLFKNNAQFFSKLNTLHASLSFLQYRCFIVRYFFNLITPIISRTMYLPRATAFNRSFSFSVSTLLGRPTCVPFPGPNLHLSDGYW